MLKSMFALLLFLIPLGAWATNAPNAFYIPQVTEGGPFDSYAPLLPSYTDSIYFAAAGTQTYTVPTGARFVRISADCNYYVQSGASAAVPSSVLTDGSASSQNLAQGFLDPSVTQITIAVGGACKGSLDFWK